MSNEKTFIQTEHIGQAEYNLMEYKDHRDDYCQSCCFKDNIEGCAELGSCNDGSFYELVCDHKWELNVEFGDRTTPDDEYYLCDICGERVNETPQGYEERDDG